MATPPPARNGDEALRLRAARSPVRGLEAGSAAALDRPLPEINGFSRNGKRQSSRSGGAAHAAHAGRSPDPDTLPPDTANEPFHRGILPRTLWSGPHLLDAHVPHTLSKSCAVDAVTIAAQIPGRLIPWERFDHLVRHPPDCRMLSDVEVHDATAVVSQAHDRKEHPERHCWGDKEIHGDQVLHMVLQKGLPRGGRCPLPPMPSTRASAVPSLISRASLPLLRQTAPGYRPDRGRKPSGDAPGRPERRLPARKSALPGPAAGSSRLPRRGR